MAKSVIILAVSSFVIGATVFSFMLYTLIVEEQLQFANNKTPIIEKNSSSHNFQHAFNLHLDKTSIDFIVSFILLLSLLTMIFSVILITGIKKNKPSLVVAYFGFGSLLCLLLIVSAVLELLQCLWYAAIITAIIAFISMERLSIVYSFYEEMEKESDSNFLLEQDDLNQVPFDNVVCD